MIVLYDMSGERGKRRPQGEVKQINGKRVATTEYRSWQMMKNRVLNPKAKDYVRYGGRGIKIIVEWLWYENFLKDMGRKPTPQHTLERKNNDGDYCKENCIWATRKHQARNRGGYHTLSMAVADNIRALWATGQYTQATIATMFGVNQVDISQVTRNVRWARE